MIFKCSQLVKRISYKESKKLYQIKMKDIHLGQLKLLISEILFLAKYAKDGNKVLYVGAAEGYHIYQLAVLFPRLTFDLWDPSRFDIKEHKNIKKFNKFFTENDAQKYNKEGTNIVFMSDIRNLKMGEFRKYRNEKERIDEMDKLILDDMDKQKMWVQTINPIAAYLKFRVPYETDGFNYLKGTLYLQPYSPASTETRLLTTNYTDTIFYDNKAFDEKLAYFNCCMRVSIEDDRWRDIMKKYRIRNIWDNYYTLYILDYYLRTVKNIDDDEAVIKLFNELIKFLKDKYGKKYNIIYT